MQKLGQSLERCFSVNIHVGQSYWLNFCFLNCFSVTGLLSCTHHSLLALYTYWHLSFLQSEMTTNLELVAVSVIIVPIAVAIVAIVVGQW